MLECPNCGSGLRFDIPSQMMACDSCQNKFDPGSFDPNRTDGTETTDFDSTVFTCPQCGGEIYSNDDTIAGFCSFCGASTVLTSRIQKTKRPNYLIPFRITKEQCKQSYASMMRKAIFAPKALRDPQFIDGFRGIYMPYWTYYITQEGPIHLPGESSYRKGDYVYTERYDLSGDIHAYYKGLSFDASSSFDDNLSESLAPFDVKGMKEFTPAYLSGFYADTADVDKEAYSSDALWLATDASLDSLRESGYFACFQYDVNTEKIDPGDLQTKTEQIDYSLYPVWFMSYRNKDRVAYATVNGQTGRVVADLPISPVRMFLTSLLPAIPFFFLLNMIFTLLPWRAMFAVAVLAIVVMGIYSAELSAIIKRNEHANDYGYLLRHNKKEAKKVSRQKNTKVRMNRFHISGAIGTLMVCGYGLFLLFGLYFLVYDWLQNLSGRTLPTILWIVLFVAAIITGLTAYSSFDEIPGKEGSAGIISILVSILICGIIRFIAPVYDWIYYAATLLLIAAILIQLTDVIRAYNLLATRPLPQFEHKGGDDDAKD